jgi:hypothetical protein
MAVKFILLFLGVALSSAVIIGEQERQGRLQVEAARLERICANFARLNQENRRWRAALAEIGDLSVLRSRCAKIARAQAAIDKLELQRRSLKQASGFQVEGVWPSGANVRRASEWRFCGQASPADAVESVLWSARSGDVDHLASLITFEPGARQRAEEMFAGLTEEARAQYGSPEKIIATMAAAQIPTDYSAMAALSQTEPSPDSALLSLRLEDGTGVQRDLTLKFQRYEDGWSLDVPAAVVDRFAAQLDRSPNPK